VSTLDDLSLEPSPSGQRKHSLSSSVSSSSFSSSSHQSGVGLSRKNKPQRCSICKETGHKSRTCRFATGKVEVRAPSPTGFSMQLTTLIV